MKGNPFILTDREAEDMERYALIRAEAEAVNPLDELIIDKTKVVFECNSVRKTYTYPKTKNMDWLIEKIRGIDAYTAEQVRIKSVPKKYHDILAVAEDAILNREAVASFWDDLFIVKNKTFMMRCDVKSISFGKRSKYSIGNDGKAYLRERFTAFVDLSNKCEAQREHTRRMRAKLEELGINPSAL